MKCPGCGKDTLVKMDDEEEYHCYEFIQVIDWFIYTIATRCQYHKWKEKEK